MLSLAHALYKMSAVRIGMAVSNTATPSQSETMPMNVKPHRKEMKK